eukprot:TRINITY_DN7808_c0_g1_i1.p1 TRINITY_DN7808_c0_g1~~TRINITY_DN7808_c0_g1_i1.p1  ORF type:complete len:677 (-),score=82.54 TRINITY_DN7808_c0_g1_i1:456-2486(-)
MFKESVGNQLISETRASVGSTNLTVMRALAKGRQGIAVGLVGFFIIFLCISFALSRSTSLEPQVDGGEKQQSWDGLTIWSAGEARDSTNVAVVTALHGSNELLASALADIRAAHSRLEAEVAGIEEGMPRPVSKNISEPAFAAAPVDLAALLDAETRTKMLETIPSCVALLDEYNDYYKEQTRVHHLWVNAVRDEHFMKAVADKVKWMDDRKDYWLGLGFRSGQEAVDKMSSGTMADDERRQLDDFLMKYLPTESYWDPKDPDAVNKVESLFIKSGQTRQKLKDQKEDGERRLEALDFKLWDMCALQFPYANWTKQHDAILATQDRVAAREQWDGNHECVNWDVAIPGWKQVPGIHAPDPLWKQDPLQYPNPTVNVTFIMQYFKHPEMVSTIVSRLYACTEGRLGKGQIPGLTSTLLVNVDSSDEFETWYEEWKKTDEGSFLVPVFAHNVHESRGFNNLGKAARGEYLVFMQDNDVPPSDCSWLLQALDIFQKWPKVGAVGLRNDAVSTKKFDRADALGTLHLQGSQEYTPKRLYDPEIGVLMHFASVADTGPLACRKVLFQSLGGFNEGLCKKGKPCSLADWEFTFRCWLSGNPVVHVELQDELSFSAGPNAQAPGPQELFTGLQNVKINHRVIMEVYEDFLQLVTREVKRLNSHLPEAPADYKPPPRNQQQTTN